MMRRPGLGLELWCLALRRRPIVTAEASIYTAISERQISIVFFRSSEPGCRHESSIFLYDVDFASRCVPEASYILVLYLQMKTSADSNFSQQTEKQLLELQRQ